MTASTTIVNDLTPKVQYTATGGQTIFDAPWLFFDDVDLTVYLTPAGNDASDANDLITLTTDYTVTNTGTESGGTIVLNTGATAGDVITIMRIVSIDRLVDYQTSGDLLAETLNREQDDTRMIEQQLRTDIESAVRLERTDTSGASTVLPKPVANYVIGWDNAGTALANHPSVANSIGAAQNKERHVATAGQTVFTITGFTYALGIGNLAVYVNGVRYDPTLYTETDTSTVTFSQGLIAGDIVEFVSADIVTTTITSASAVQMNTQGGITTNVQAYLQTGAINVLDYIPTSLHASIKDGTNTTDLSSYIQSAIDTIYTVASSSFVNYEASIGKNKSIHFPSGFYLVKYPLTFGQSGKVLYKASLVFDKNASLVGDGFANANDFVLTIYNINSCLFDNLEVRGEDCNGLQILESRNSDFRGLGVGSASDYSLRISGVFFNNTFFNTRVNQNVALNGATYGVYADFTSIPVSAVTVGSGGPINTWSGLYISGCDTGFIVVADRSVSAWQTGAWDINGVEIEGVTVKAFKFVQCHRPITMSNIWSESNLASAFEFDNCSSVSVRDAMLGNYNADIEINNCGLCTFENIDGSTGPQPAGHNGSIIVSNCRFTIASSRLFLRGLGASNVPPLYRGIDNINVKNVHLDDTESVTMTAISYNNSTEEMTITAASHGISSSIDFISITNNVITYTDSVGTVTDSLNGNYPFQYIDSNNFKISIKLDDYVGGEAIVYAGGVSDGTYGFNSIKTATINNADNLLVDGRCLSITSGVTSYKCTFADDAGYTDVSPFGYREVLVTITDAAAEQYLEVDFDVTKRTTGGVMPMTLLTAWRINPDTGSELIFQSGSITPAEVITSGYGDFHYKLRWKGNDYLVTATRMWDDGTDTKTRFYWNYGATHNNGDKFVFGGAIMYYGHDIVLPNGAFSSNEW